MNTPEELTPETGSVSESTPETGSVLESTPVEKSTSRTPLFVAIAVGVVAVAIVAWLAFSGGLSNKNVAAKVNGEKISTQELDKQVVQLQKQYPDMFKGTDGEGRLLDFKQRLLDNLVNQMLVAQAAEDRGIKVTDAEVDKQIKQLKDGFKDDAQFQAALKSAGMTEDALKEQIREQLMTQKIIESLAKDVKISDKEMKAYYDANKAQFQQKAAKRAQHILFKPEDKSTATKVLAQLKDGGDFGALAKEYSVDTATAKKGGDLGWPSTPYVDEFEAALKKLDKGEMSDLVKTPYGWHIIKVSEVRTSSQQTFTEAKSQIEQILIQQKRADAYQKFLDALRKKAKIEILIDELKASSTAKKTTTK